MSDIDTVAVDSLKALDPNRPIREADMPFLALQGYSPRIAGATTKWRRNDRNRK